MSGGFPSLDFRVALDEAQAGRLAAQPSPAPEHRTDDRTLDTASLSTLTSALDRLEDLLVEETAALHARAPIDFAEISRRKSRSLLELSRIARAVPPRLDAPTLARVRRLREALQENFDLLGLHLGAAQEVGALLHEAIREAESDGTYSMSYGRGLL